MFMTDEALAGFKRRAELETVGVDGSVTIVTVGFGGSIDTDKIAKLLSSGSSLIPRDLCTI